VALSCQGSLSRVLHFLYVLLGMLLGAEVFSKALEILFFIYSHATYAAIVFAEHNSLAQAMKFS
ncbi:MAG: hypothetical protein JRN67_04445, partial [Nitrososphaerota archaeon]|nr:hypothetical protein [Nitrososphaerota archaeon]